MAAVTAAEGTSCLAIRGMRFPVLVFINGLPAMARIRG
jgi:hypothetical protein